MTRGFPCCLLTSLLLAIALSPDARAQVRDDKFEVGAQFASLRQRVFDFKDFGFGGRFTYHPVRFLGLETEVNFFPRGMDNVLTFSASRTQALFGIKAGPRFSRFGVFARVRPGIIHYAPARERSVCLTILVYPPPLECRIALGSTNFVLDSGGGFEVYPSRRSTIRFDVGDTAIQYDAANTRLGTFMEKFRNHDLQVNIGFGYRF